MRSIFYVQPNYSLRTFTGHQTSVMSLDFHPNNEDLLCSCDGDSEIRYWNVNQGICTRVFKVCCMTKLGMLKIDMLNADMICELILKVCN